MYRDMYLSKYYSIRPIRSPTATSLLLPSIPPILCWRNPSWLCHWLAYFPPVPAILTTSGRVNAVHRPHRTDLQTVASVPCTCCLGPNSPPALSYLGPLRIPMDHGPLKLSSTHKQFRLEPSASSSFELALWPLSWLCCVLCPPAHAWLLGCCQSARVCCGVRAVQRETGNKQKSMQMARPRMVLTRALPR
ncbi:hypothetical protein COCSADRAFT_327892 [Bipolaris sorokiniana ND90Pr]|uniref:Uncharacterized protein n=1 Tax=Cochliobolus sativus (strain ND90Pr / ATCC 201652) TaxID=665912 RepID=M2T2J9_COCSN|nr:uncharacterized protein COCSADRAFT_327892 [Bipolaris sorokiniana ND90Pr]EMD63431.1 hypothetical protein COCSADRAFT_327892 [Bipolaris sorokiniana ND90Pr]